VCRHMQRAIARSLARSLATTLARPYMYSCARRPPMMPPVSASTLAQQQESIPGVAAAVACTCCCQSDPCTCWVDEFADQDADIFGEELAAELAQCALDSEALRESSRRCQEATPPLGSRSASESRRLYMNAGALRREVVTLSGVFSRTECRRLISAAEQAATVRGGCWHTTRHADHPTTDMPLRELETSVASFAGEKLDALVLTPTAVHRGFRSGQLVPSCVYDDVCLFAIRLPCAALRSYCIAPRLIYACWVAGVPRYFYCQIPGAVAGP
jgi:hypothetical protein